MHFYEALFDIDAINAYLKENTGAKQSAPSTTQAPVLNDPDDDNEENDVHPSTPVYRKGFRPPPKIQESIRKPTVINGRQYSKHAIERMQERGYTPTIVENAIKNGGQSQDPDIRNLRHYDAINNIGVVTDKASGLVVTIRDGIFK